MTAILIGVISMIGIGLGTGILSKITKEIGGIKTLFIRSVVSTSISIIAFIIFISEAKFSFKYVLIAIGVATIGYLGVSSFYRGLGAGKVGIVAPVGNSSVIITVILAAILFNQKISSFQIVAILLIIIGIILISVNFKDFLSGKFLDKSSGVHFALMAMFFWGITFAFLKFPVDVLGPFLTTLIVESTNLFYSGGQLLAKGDFSFRNKIKVSNILPILVGSAVGALGFLFFNIGIESYNVSIIAALAASNPLISAIYGGIFNKERLNLQQYFGVLICVVGIIIISAV